MSFRLVAEPGEKAPRPATALDAFEGSLGRNTVIKMASPDGDIQPAFNGRQRDLVDIAAAYYRADQLSLRRDAPDGWTRRLDVEFASAEAAHWNDGWARRVGEAARFLAGDDLRVRALQRDEPKPWYTGIHRRGLPEGFDEVCLFSGGLDSLSGAVGLLDAGKRVLLVGHIGDNTTGGYQQRGFDYLSKLFGDRVRLVRLSVRHAPGEEGARETTHRSRSFLFLANATAIASTVRVQRVSCPENGVISLNLPFDESRLSAFSTRTAHPKFLALFQGLADGLGFQVRLQNPHLHKTKAQVVEALSKKHVEAAIMTTSCSRQGRPHAETKVGGKRVDYCGRCMPCIQRSIAFENLGILNRPRVDVRRQGDGKRPELRGMNRLAGRIRDASDIELDLQILGQGHFAPSVSHALGGPASTSLKPWRDMLRRWVAEYDHYMQEASAATKRRIGVP